MMHNNGKHKTIHVLGGNLWYFRVLYVFIVKCWIKKSMKNVVILLIGIPYGHAIYGSNSLNIYDEESKYRIHSYIM